MLDGCFMFLLSHTFLKIEYLSSVFVFPRTYIPMVLPLFLFTVSFWTVVQTVLVALFHSGPLFLV